MKDREFLERMGAKVKAARKAANMTQQQLADLCRFDDSSISQIEHGNYSLKVTNLKRIADVLNMDVKEFL
jgi:transcriptional regulator with XRE-family HTH domain